MTGVSKVGLGPGLKTIFHFRFLSPNVLPNTLLVLNLIFPSG